MIANIKATGEEIIVEPYSDEFAQILPDGDYKVYTKQELSFPNDIDWQQVRIQAAIAAMQGMLSSKETMESITKQASNHNISVETALAKLAVIDADALVAELKRSEDVYAECRRMAAINTASVCENMTKIQKEIQKKVRQDE